MTPRDVLVLVWGDLRAHRVRTRLTYAAIAIGIGAVLILTSLGEGARAWVINRFTTLGANVLVVLPGRTETRGVALLMPATTRDITLADMEAVARRLSGVQRVTPVVIGEAQVSFEQRARRATVVGSTHDFLGMRNVPVDLGTDLPEMDLHRGMRVCVLGCTLAREVLGEANPLGARIRIGNYPFRVIGVIAAKHGESMMANADEMVLVPVKNAMRMFNRTGLFRLVVQLFPSMDLATATTRLQAILKDRHDGEEDFTIMTPGSVAASLTKIVVIITSALAGIAAISLAVAGIGVMNVMVISVVERTNEIGLMKAIGASNAQVLTLFLAQAIALALVGGACGIAVGWFVTRIAAALLPTFPFPVPAWAVSASLAVAGSVGLTFGILPALRAARMLPLQALRRKW